MSYDDDDDGDKGFEGEDEDLAALQSALNVLYRSSDSAGPSDVDHLAGVTTKDCIA